MIEDKEELYWHTTQLCTTCGNEHRFCYKSKELPLESEKIYYQCPLKNKEAFLQGNFGWSSRSHPENNSISCYLK